MYAVLTPAFSRREALSPSRIDWGQVPSPCFVMDEARLEVNMAFYKELQATVPLEVLLALKGFAMFSVFDRMQGILKGTTASSLHELQLGSRRFGGQQHIFMPAYPPAQVEEIAALAHHVSFNSVGQFLRHGPRMRQINPKIALGLRLNPGFSPVATELYNPCAAGSRLGIRLATLLQDNPALEAAGMNPDFLHCHNLCESSAADLERTLDILARDFRPWLERVTSLNLGGGHLMTASSYDLSRMVGVVEAFHRQFPHLKLWIEPGSALVWETGYLRASVVEVVDTDTFPVAILDASITAHLPDVLEMPYRPAVWGAESLAPGETAVGRFPHCYRLGGQSCLAGDQVGIYRFERRLQEGDLILFEDMMHYTMVKTNTFNGMELPSIGIWQKDHSFETVKRFGYEDFESRLS